MNKLFDATDDSPLFPLLEERDYYIENGCWVFTSHFLQKRGTCCGSGCRHCPYRAQPLETVVNDATHSDSSQN